MLSRKEKPYVQDSEKVSMQQNWQENLSVGLKLAALLEQENPGITRSVTLSPYRYNMDLCPGSLLVEVGGHGNTLADAIEGARFWADTAARALKNT